MVLGLGPGESLSSVDAAWLRMEDSYQPDDHHRGS